MAGLRLRCRGGDFAEECHHALNQDKSEIPEPVDDTTGLVDAEHRPGGPGTSAGLPLLETADTQQAALRDGDRAGERGQVVTGDHLRERSGHGPRRLVRRAQYQDAGMATRRVRPDVAQSAVEGDQQSFVSGCSGHDLRIRRPAQVLVDDGVDIVSGGDEDLAS
jgi:hypothetical protein